MATKEDLTKQLAIAEQQISAHQSADLRRRTQISKIIGRWDTEPGAYRSETPLSWEQVFSHLGRLVAEGHFGDWQMKVTHLEQLFHTAIKNYEDKGKSDQG